MSRHIIGVDPGDSAGVAIITDDDDLLGVPRLFHVFQGTPSDALTLVELMIARGYDDEDVTVVCERFVSMRSRRGRTHQPTAQRMGGAIEHVAQHHGVRFVYQNPSDAWAVASNDLLQRLGMLQTGQSIGQRDADDANMAVRHALLYLAQHRATRFDALLKSVGWFSTDAR